MSLIRFSALSLLLLICGFTAEAQFWFGPKSGIQLIRQAYQLEGYTDEYNPKNNIINWHIGGVVNYTTSEKYSIHMELLYESVRRRVDDRGNTPDSIIVRSNLTYHFITAPVMFRVQFGRSPIRYYVNAGPQFRFWAAGKGKMVADELFENSETGIRNYKIRFRDAPENPELDDFYVPNPNRIQYAFLVGGGLSLDLFNRPHRLMIDARYAFGHSIMAFNRGTEQSQLASYSENFEFRDNTVMISVAYLFGFNPIDIRKGSSTINKRKLR